MIIIFYGIKTYKTKPIAITDKNIPEVKKFGKLVVVFYRTIFTIMTVPFFPLPLKSKVYAFVKKPDSDKKTPIIIKGKEQSPELKKAIKQLKTYIKPHLWMWIGSIALIALIAWYIIINLINSLIK